MVVPIYDDNPFVQPVKPVVTWCLIAANLALAAIFLPRARRLAAQTGMTWPTAFEAATRRHLKERLGVAFG